MTVRHFADDAEISAPMSLSGLETQSHRGHGDVIATRLRVLCV